MPVEIHVTPGTYVEHIYVSGQKSFVGLIGTNPAITKITYNTPTNNPDYNTWTCATVYFESNDFSIEGLSIENSYGVGVQSLAFSAGGSQGQFKNVRFQTNQDTLLLYTGPFYLISCRIEGTTDFMYGNTCSSLLNANGTNAKVIQSHMHHSTVDMTMNVYPHADTEQARAVINALPEFDKQPVQKTGTDDTADDAVGTGIPAKPSPKNTSKKNTGLFVKP